jgi:hypothetical protein
MLICICDSFFHDNLILIIKFHYNKNHNKLQENPH